MRMYQVDAFTNRLFAGNPAAVVPLDGWPDDDTLLAISAENNLSETAFIVPCADGADFELRWFTPVEEVPLCGHATLATAHVLFEHLGFEPELIRFSTRWSGELIARKTGEGIQLDFPAEPMVRCSLPAAEHAAVLAGVGPYEPTEILRTENRLFCVFQNEDEVRAIQPDISAIKSVDVQGIVVTAPGHEHDFVSRFFAPAVGIEEDPVCGSAHCSLAPYWSQRLGKSRLRARQVSPRGGDVLCELVGGRVRLTGNAVTYLSGTIAAEAFSA